MTITTVIVYLTLSSLLFTIVDINEDKFLNMTNKDFINNQSIPFEYHKKKN